MRKSCGSLAILWTLMSLGVAADADQPPLVRAMNQSTAASTAPAAVTLRLRVPLFGPSATVRRTPASFWADPLSGIRKPAAPSAFQNPAGSASSSLFSNGFTTMSFGAEGSAGGVLSGGSAPYAGVLSVSSAHALQFGSSNLVRMTVAAGGNVGIGTTSPAQKLSVAGAIESTSGGFKFPDGSVQTTASGSGLWTPSGANINFASGNVGIGVASPGQKLSVAGAIESTSGGFRFPDGTVQTTATAAAVSPWTTAGANVNYAAGNVGIGTTSPAEKLHVSGNVRIDSGNHLILDRVYNDYKWHISNDANNYLSIDNYTSAGVLYHHAMTITDTLGNVGIGTTSPQTKLDVVGASNTSPALIVTGGTFSAGRGAPIASLAFSQNNYTSGNRLLAVIEAQGGDDTYGDRGQLAFKTGYLGGTGSISQKMVLDFNGNLGVGTATPTAKLHVAGDIVANGNIAAHYQDVAEWVDAVEPLEAGTIVAIDPSGSDRVIASEKAYDVRVAGAVSAQPGLILGDGGAGRVMVAQSGRVRVKVDATFGAIRAGDLLVTSPTPGYAMRSEPIDMAGTPIHRPGTVLGKALESLASGRGEILVLLTLQ